MVHCESFLPSMRDHSEDSNSCNWSMYGGDKNLPPYGQQYQNGFSARPAPPESYSGNERDVLKQTMLEHEAVFKNQVHELHRLYRTQKSLMDEVKGKTFLDHMNQSEHTPESAIKRELPGFLLGNSMCGGEGSSAQACSVPMQNGIRSKDDDVFEVRPVTVKRKMIDLQLPAEEYLDTEGENTSCPPNKQSKAGREAGEKQLFLGRGNASNQNGSLVMKNTDLNEPVQCQESLPVSASMDFYSLCGRNMAQAQSQWLEKNSGQNGWRGLEAGQVKSTPRDKSSLPSHSVQALSNSAFQPLVYPSNDHRRLSGEWEAPRQRNPEVSYDSYVESSVASNAPSLHHAYRPESVRPWSHWIPSWDNRSGSSVQKPLPLQTNPFLNFNAQARADSSSGMRSHDFGGPPYQGFSSGSKETASAFNFPSGNLNHLNNGTNGALTNGSLSSEALKQNFQGPRKQESSAKLPWIIPKPSNKNETINGGFDLNASASDVCDSSNGLRSVSYSNGANMGRVNIADSQSFRKILGFPITQHPPLIPSSVCLADQPRGVNTLVKRNLDINLPCEASGGSEAVVMDKVEGKKAATSRHFIDLNLCASEDEDFTLATNPRVERKATTLIDLEAPPSLESEEEAGDSVDELIKAAAEAIVTISLSCHCRTTDESASSSTNPVAEDPLSWFVNTIASCGNDLEKKIDACLEVRDCEGGREECSSGEFDYFEAMTLNLPQTKEEDYMPTPLVPEYLKLDGTDSMGVTANRPRRGQARRGRPRRDFQRDILPGLASLSRLEVTEDLQMFGGLMKATGYSWSSGVARRSSNRGGSSRGRKRLVSNIDIAPVCLSNNNNSVQMVGLEDRSLTGWGNASRRPRRQRCPAGTSSPTVILT
ncbi:unnamed protein product [Microthlaspi erraticum]|uniref:Uncharacterized protein n=1 Tax=Microthlaspi erraticum TaxID=1685480 RepID=A0A6D2HRU6_9BRAS|nr:unnamed protein product [Microthlaspi erraticum]